GGKTIRRKQLRHELAFGKVRPNEFEIRECLELRDSGLLQMRIVIGIEVVEADHVIAVRQQPPRDMHADEPGRSGDENRLLQARSFQVTGDAPVRASCPAPFALGCWCFGLYKKQNAKGVDSNDRSAAEGAH